MRVLTSESTPKTKGGRGVQGAPSMTFRATLGTQSTASQAADASPARGIAAVTNPQVTADALMLRTCAHLKIGPTRRGPVQPTQRA